MSLIVNRSDSGHTSHGSAGHGSIILVTLYPDPHWHEEFMSDMQRIPFQFKRFAESVPGHFKFIDSLRLNILINHHSSLNWNLVLKHVEGVDIAIETCRRIPHSVQYPARFLTLHLDAHDCQPTHFEMVAAKFPHVHDLRLKITDNQDNFCRPNFGIILKPFSWMTSLSIVLKRLAQLDLSNLNQLHSLRISSELYSEALELALSASLRSLAIESQEKRISQFPILNLTRALRAHLDTLEQLQSIEIRNCRLQVHEGTVLQFFPARLISLNLQESAMMENLLLGDPHGNLRELRLKILTSGALPSLPRLQVLSCLGTPPALNHPDHLRVMWIDSLVDCNNSIASLTQFSSLTELWVPVSVFTQEARNSLTSTHKALEVLPPTLDILVLGGDALNCLNRHWQLKCLKRVRFLGLHTNLKIVSATLPPFLHTLAVPTTKLEETHTTLSEARLMPHLMVFDRFEWLRGPTSGRFFLNPSQDETTVSLHEIQARQRRSESRHHHQS